MNYKLILETPAVIVGMGITGESTEKLLLASGFSRGSTCRFDFACFDARQVDADFNDAEKMLIEMKPKTLIVSPGVPLTSAWIQAFKKQGGCVTSELDLAYQTLTTERVIAISGSVGKSTTVALLRAGFEKSNIPYFVGGNIGVPLADYSRQLILGEREQVEWVVLELSSYQLENFSNLKADYSAITFLTANHLERYDSKVEYYQTKWNLLNHTLIATVLNRNGGDLVSWSHSHELPNSIHWAHRDSSIVETYQLNKFNLIGSHNLDNLAVAATLAKLGGFIDSILPGMLAFPGLEHRVENLGLVRGVRYINDSKATTIESVKTALNSVLETAKARVFLLLGGKDKNLPWNLLQILAEPVGAGKIVPVFFGSCGTLAQRESGLKGEVFEKMQGAVDFAIAKAQLDDVVLLSPGGTSLDEFKNFEHRGEVFKSFNIFRSNK